MHFNFMGFRAAGERFSYLEKSLIALKETGVLSKERKDSPNVFSVSRNTPISLLYLKGAFPH